jgi:hypothetical protein
MLMKKNRIIKYLVCGLIGLSAGFVNAQERFEYAPIFYYSRPLSNAMSRVSMDQLTYEPEQGYLKSVLKALNISPASQVLVFKSTSFQKDLIKEKNPRALYFNDMNYVGWIPGSDVLEIISVDPYLGPIFYTINQNPAELLQIKRNNEDCLDCHSGAKTQSVPGLFVFSSFPKGGGRYNNINIYHQTPMKDRWGGWYVTGEHGAAPHQGNLPEGHEIEFGENFNLTDLNPFFNTESYLTPHSDLMALMVLDHQCHMFNLFIRANYRVRLLMHDEKMNPDELTENPPERVEREVGMLSKAVVRYLLYTKEAKLDGTLSGTSDFVTQFAARGIRDNQDRSLRDFDGEQRLFKYPCSYLIYSESFQTLPTVFKQAVYQRLHTVLTTNELDEDFPHLSAEDKKAIYEILKDTLPNLPDCWK